MKCRAKTLKTAALLLVIGLVGCGGYQQVASDRRYQVGKACDLYAHALEAAADAYAAGRITEGAAHRIDVIEARVTPYCTAQARLFEGDAEASRQLQDDITDLINELADTVGVKG